MVTAQSHRYALRPLIFPFQLAASRGLPLLLLGWALLMSALPLRRGPALRMRPWGLWSRQKGQGRWVASICWL